MLHTQGASKNTCNLLAVYCGRTAENKQERDVADEKTMFPFPVIVSSGHLEVRILPGYLFGLKSSIYEVLKELLHAVISWLLFILSSFPI